MFFRNPIYSKLVHRIYFQDVELFVFCTKNPRPMLPFLKEIKQPILFQITLTPYQKDIEPNVPSKKEIIEDIKIISSILGKDFVFVRYDPIFLSKKYSLNYHIKAFERFCSLLEGFVTKIIVSFMDNYKNVQKNMTILQAQSFAPQDFKEIGKNFSRIAKEHGMTVQTCSEYETLEEYGFLVNDCVPRELVKNITGRSYPKWQSRNSKYCHCAKMW